jgi:putative molybdopterin biosynthesis protein
MEPNRALTPSEVAERLQVAKNTVYELIKRGELRGYRVGNQVRVDEQDLEDFRRPPRAPAVVPEAPVAQETGLVLSGQDAVLDLLARWVEVRAPGVRVLRSMAGSYPGLSGLYLGSIHASAIHLWNAATGVYNADFVRALVPGTPTVSIRIATRSVGWYVPRGNPTLVEGWEALGRADLVLANRERGSGVRVLLDGRLGMGRWVRPRGYDREFPSHNAVASAVVRGDADYGLGNEKTAQAVAGLTFLPLQTEDYDLVVRRSDLAKPGIAALAEVLRSPEFHRELEGLGGYGTAKTGTVVDET